MSSNAIIDEAKGETVGIYLAYKLKLLRGDVSDKCYQYFNQTNATNTLTFLFLRFIIELYL